MQSPDYIAVAIQPPSETWDADSTLVYARLAATYRIAAANDPDRAIAAQSVSNE